MDGKNGFYGFAPIFTGITKVTAAPFCQGNAPHGAYLPFGHIYYIGRDCSAGRNKIQQSVVVVL